MRGQVSLDLILAIAFAFIAMSAILLVGDELGRMQVSASVRQQLEDIGNGLSETISTATVLDDADPGGVRLEFAVPKLKVPGDERFRACKIEFSEASGSGKMTLSYDIYDLETGALLDKVEVEKDYI